MAHTHSSRYAETYQASMTDRETFWLNVAKSIDWIKPPSRAFDASQGVYGRWFPDAEVNTCYNALDRHVAERGDQLAVIYDSPVTGSKSQLTYREMRDQVARLAAVIRDQGVEKGDTVLIYMPMIPEALMAMLACARLGAVHSVVFGGFASKELATRIEDAHPKLIVVQRPQAHATLIAGRDLDWVDAMAGAEKAGKSADCVPVKATDPLYVLYTSGTTGKPKGVVRDNGGHLAALAWSVPNLYDIHAGDVFWTASDVGWVVGHSYIVYGPLVNGATTVVYEGKPVGTPDPGAFWRRGGTSVACGQNGLDCHQIAAAARQSADLVACR